jgi:hypothetical protein
MSSYDVVMPKAKKIEKLLRDRGYEGRTLGEVLRSSGSDLPIQLKKAIRQVLFIRNELSHKDELDELPPQTIVHFNECADLAIAELTNGKSVSSATVSGRSKVPEGSTSSAPKAPARKAVAAKKAAPVAKKAGTAKPHRKTKAELAEEAEREEQELVKHWEKLMLAAQRELEDLPAKRGDKQLQADPDYTEAMAEIRKLMRSAAARERRAAAKVAATGTGPKNAKPARRNASAPSNNAQKTVNTKAQELRNREQVKFELAHEIELAETYRKGRLSLLRAAAERELDRIPRRTDNRFYADPEYVDVKAQVQKEREAARARKARIDLNQPQNARAAAALAELGIKAVGSLIKIFI